MTGFISSDKGVNRAGRCRSWVKTVRSLPPSLPGWLRGSHGHTQCIPGLWDKPSAVTNAPWSCGPYFKKLWRVQRVTNHQENFKRSVMDSEKKHPNNCLLELGNRMGTCFKNNIPKRKKTESSFPLTTLGVAHHHHYSGCLKMHRDSTWQCLHLMLGDGGAQLGRFLSSFKYPSTPAKKGSWPFSCSP